MIENKDYYVINREEWNDYLSNESPHRQVTISEEQLGKITSLNDELTSQDAYEVYKPITELISVYLKNYKLLTDKRDYFLGIKRPMPPFIIGIAGSVAVGKSTAARLLQIFLSQFYPELQVALATTDGFIYPNKILKEKGIMDKKGFPDSYNMPALIDFLKEIKNGHEHIPYPTYSHKVYDIIPDKMQYLDKPDIVILEGINVLQFPSNTNIYLSDFFDLSIYINADEDIIEQWFYERFKLLVNNARNTPSDYYYKFNLMSEDEAMAYATKVWHDINLVNLHEYILPTRPNADIVIHKEAHHRISELWLKKY